MTSTRSVDLRSDTVTRPTRGMRAAMADAEVGDDVFGDDPTVNRLQERVACMFGMEAALFVPSGTMANQIAIRAHTEPGNEIICHRLSHVYLYEAGAPFALAGCSIALLDGPRGMLTADDVRRSVRPPDQHFAQSRLVVMENTQNRGGGTVWPIERIAAVAREARQFELRTHLDARIMNACAANGAAPAEYAGHVDSASICFSKGLGAPVGSAVAGSAATIERARRFRKMYGGAMRQVGVLAAAAEYALDHHVDRIADDHANARQIADVLATCPGVSVESPETNIVYFDLDPTLGTAHDMERRAEERGVRLIALGPQTLRAVTHLDVSAEDTERAANVLAAMFKAS